MYRHGPTCLAGPVSKARVVWIWSDTGATETDTVTLEPQDAVDPRASCAAGRGSSRTDIRMDLVQRVRREIAEGVYDTPDKWDAALDALLDRLEQAD